MRGHVHLYVCASLFTLCLPLCETVSLLSFFLPRVGDCTACATHDIWDLRDYFHVTIHSRASHIWISIRLVHKFVSFTYLSISWAWRGQSEPGGRSALRQTRQSRRNRIRCALVQFRCARYHRKHLDRKMFRLIYPFGYPVTRWNHSRVL